VTAQPQEPPSGKGRPTPKRREAEQQRKQRLRTPLNTREATKQGKNQQKRRRREAREALLSGDITKMAPRDAGPMRAFVRDYVDTRRNAGTLFLPAAFFIFGFSAVGLPILGNVLLLLVVAAIGIDSRNLGRGVVREVRKRFPGDDTKGLRIYAVTRAMQIRRLRLPRPRVKHGDKV
jgi:hypothetical protein